MIDYCFLFIFSLHNNVPYALVCEFSIINKFNDSFQLLVKYDKLVFISSHVVDATSVKILHIGLILC